MQQIKKAAKNLLFNISTPALNGITKFRNKHKGESCYIFGDGISIKYFDLGLFSDRIAFAGNYIPFHNDFNKLNAEYCVVSAPFFFSPFFGYNNPVFKKYLYRMSGFYREIIDGNPGKSFFVNLSNYPWIRKPNIYYDFLKYPAKGLPENFISDRINCFSGVLRNSVSLAIYMGFTDIYLVGCDYTFSPTQHYHWYETGQGELLDRPGYEKDFLEIAGEYANLITITLNGASDVMNYITYNDFTGTSPVYKENDTLISERYLSGLKMWPGYKI